MKEIQFNYTIKHKCRKAACIEDCCSGWTINVSENKLNEWKTQKPELLKKVENNPHNDNSRIKLSKDKDLPICAYFKNGLCDLHKEHGEKYLPDICKKFPLINKHINKTNFKFYTSSCISIADLIINAENDAFHIQKKYNSNITENDNIDIVLPVSLEYAVSINRKIIENIEYYQNADVAAAFIFALASTYNNTVSSIECKNYLSAFPKAAFDMTIFMNESNEQSCNLESYTLFVLNLFGKVVTQNRKIVNNIFRDLEVKLRNPDKINSNYKLWLDSESQKYDKSLKNILKGKIAEHFFPFIQHEEVDLFDRCIIILLEYLIVRFLLIINCDIEVSPDTISTYFQAVDREFYSKKNIFLKTILNDLNYEAVNELVVNYCSMKPAIEEYEDY